MTDGYADQIPFLPVGAKRDLAVSFDDDLDSGDTISGAPTIEELDTSDLTIENAAANASEITILKRRVAAGRAVVATISGHKDGKTYKLKITVTTADGEIVLGGTKFQSGAID